MRFVISFFFLKNKIKKSYSGGDHPPLNSVVLCASYRRDLIWHSQSSVNGTSASNLVTNKVCGSRKWQQLSKIVPIKKNDNKKKPAQWNPKVNHTTPLSEWPQNTCKQVTVIICLQCVWQQKQYWNLKRGTKPPRSSIMSLHIFVWTCKDGESP